MHVTNTTIGDIESIFSIYSEAINYQQRKGFELWPEFDKDMIEQEIIEKRNWKIISGNEIACVFSVQYSDPAIWKERNNDPAIYLHRIATHPDHKGKGIISFVRNWAVDHAVSLDKKYVRMDTWGNNKNLRDYYISHGFKYLGQSHLSPEEEKQHYGGAELSLLQIETDPLIEIVEYKSEYQKRFKEINEQWINRSFVMEEEDRITLDHPEEHVLKNGGRIFIALYNNYPVGTCAYLNFGDNVFEMIKMAVDENFRGLKIGKIIGERSLDKMKEAGSKKIILFSNTHGSAVAVELYKKLGFHEVPLGESEFIRANIRMEMEF